MVSGSTDLRTTPKCKANSYGKRRKAWKSSSDRPPSDSSLQRINSSSKHSVFFPRARRIPILHPQHRHWETFSACTNLNRKEKSMAPRSLNDQCHVPCSLFPVSCFLFCSRETNRIF